MAAMASSVSAADVPTDMRGLRACLRCSRVQTETQFMQFGCANCEPTLHFKNNRARMQECTSASFSGLISLMQPDASWVAKWQHLGGQAFARGCYAIDASGRLPAGLAGAD